MPSFLKNQTTATFGATSIFGKYVFGVVLQDTSRLPPQKEGGTDRAAPWTLLSQQETTWTNL